jgi:hypothetical protein
MRSEKRDGIATVIAFFLGALILIAIWYLRIRGILGWFK